MQILTEQFVAILAKKYLCKSQVVAKMATNMQI